MYTVDVSALPFIFLSRPCYSRYFRACPYILVLCTMSTFVSGVGDEVVLFAAFLVLSAAFICFISLYKKGSERTGQEQGEKCSLSLVIG